MMFDKKEDVHGPGPTPAPGLSLEDISSALEAMVQGADGEKRVKLQQAYDLVESLKGPSAVAPEEGVSPDDEMVPEKPALNTGMLLGPMSNFKNYLAKKSVDSQERPQ